MTFPSFPAQLKTPATPVRPIEVSAITQCARPKRWRAFDTAGGDEDEIKALQAGEWFPTTETFREVARVPHGAMPGVTKLVEVGTFHELVSNAIIGNPPRPAGSLLQLNIIGHAGAGNRGAAIGLTCKYLLAGDPKPNDPSGTAVLGPEDGDVFFDSIISGTQFELTPLENTSLDESTLDWFAQEAQPEENRSGDAADQIDLARVKLRDDARAAFFRSPTGPRAQILLVVCRIGIGTAPARKMLQAMAKAFQVRVVAWQSDIVYHPDPNETVLKTRRIKKSELLTSSNFPVEPGSAEQPKEGPRGRGYPCAMPVNPSFRGEHLGLTIGTRVDP